MHVASGFFLELLGDRYYIYISIHVCMYTHIIIPSEPDFVAMVRSKLSDRCNLALVALMTPGKVMLFGCALALRAIPGYPNSAIPTSHPAQFLLPVVPSTTSEAGRCPGGDTRGTPQQSLSTQGHMGFGDR